jgi:hypothetical protein
MLAYPATTPRQRRPAYPFPELDPGQIASCLENLDINLSESDIRKPTAGQVLKLFEILGEKLMSVRFGQFVGSFGDEAERERMLDDITDHPECHANSLPLLTFFHHWYFLYGVLGGHCVCGRARLMADIGVPEFTLIDWLKPESKRLVVILSGIINFARFRDVNLSVFDELTQRAVPVFALVMVDCVGSVFGNEG